MPLWHIYCPENAYSAEDKCALATRITDLYADVGLPRFYASVVFHELPKNSFFVGGKATNDFVRIWIDQIARTTAPERRAWWLERVNTTLNPFARERGYRWEVHIDQTPIDFWTIQGMKPPDPDSEAESTGSKRTARRHIPECGRNLFSELIAAMGINPPSFYAAFGSKGAAFPPVLDMYSRQGPHRRRCFCPTIGPQVIEFGAVFSPQLTALRADTVA